MLKLGKHVVITKAEHERLVAAQDVTRLLATEGAEKEKYKPTALCEGCAYLMEKEERIYDDWGGPPRRCTVRYCRKNNTCPDHTCDVAKGGNA